VEELLLGLFFVPLGFVAGFQVWIRLVSWIYPIWTILRGRHRSMSSGERASWKGPLLAALFMHSGPYLVALVIAFTVYIFSTPHRAEWNWFFGGALIVPLYVGINLLFWYKRQKHTRSPSAQP
jgi:hypothetical protein